jgi:hypothetical protein
MTHEPLVKSVMSPFPHAVPLDAPLLDARRLMLGAPRSAFARDAESRIEGHHHGPGHQTVVRPRDGLIRTRANLRSKMDSLRTLYVVDINSPLSEVVLEMAERHIGAALVTGMVGSQASLPRAMRCRVLGEWLRERFPRGHGRRLRIAGEEDAFAPFFDEGAKCAAHINQDFYAVAVL